MKKFYGFFALFLSLSVLVFAQETKLIQSEGVATVGSDPAAARDKAVEDALRRAVEQAVGTMIESETAVENYQLLSDRIYSQSSGYVKNYKILSENKEGNLLRVKIEAEVSSGAIGNDLSGIGILQRRLKYPRVMVMIVENNVLNSASLWNVYTVSNSQAESTISERLKSRGFNVVDPHYQRKVLNEQEARDAWQGNYGVAGKFGKKVGAEVVIVGQAASTRSANNIYGSDLLSVTSTLTASAVKAGTGEVLAQSSAQGTAAHINEVAALQQALAKASDKVAEDLMSGIVTAWQREASGVRSVAMEVNGISPQEVEKLKTTLEKMRGVTEVLVRNISEGSADLDIKGKWDAQDLSASIGKVTFPGFKMVLVESSLDHLQYNILR
jgi:hypothetical protein